MTYEFECVDCHYIFEKKMMLRLFERWKSKDVKFDCPNCHGRDLKNLIGKPGVNLGNGFSRRAF